MRREAMGTPITSSTLRIEHLDEAHLGAVIECVTAVWIADNVIARALGVTADDYRPVATRICERALADRLGLMLRDTVTGAIMGFYTAIDLVDELDEVRAGTIEVSPRMRRWGAMLSRGLQWYLDAFHHDQPLARGEALYFNIGGTVAELRGRGFITRMSLIAGTDFAFGRRYRRIVAIATHPHTVHMTRSLPFETHLHELRFADCGDPDLARISDPPHALVSVTELVHPSMARDWQRHTDAGSLS